MTDESHRRQILGLPRPRTTCAAAVVCFIAVALSALAPRALAHDSDPCLAAETVDALTSVDLAGEGAAETEATLTGGDHTGGPFNFSEQEFADLEAYLATF